MNYILMVNLTNCVDICGRWQGYAFLVDCQHRIVAGVKMLSQWTKRDQRISPTAGINRVLNPLTIRFLPKLLSSFVLFNSTSHVF
jgi:hypothetical protein